jgi:hypothetical protein
MARYRGKRSFTVAGGGDEEEDREYSPTVDKNPFYRTMDIFNGVFKKEIKLRGGSQNKTDLGTIWVDFEERTPSLIVEVLRPALDPTRSWFKLKCGHEWEGKTLKEDGIAKIPNATDYGMCAVCGAEGAYRGFEHEWQHIIFKSDLVARAIFCEQYADMLSKQYNVLKEQIEPFLSLLVNVFDDLRVNSLWEKVYPGSATFIWERWRRLTMQRRNEVNTNFLAYIFAVAFSVPTDPNGEFEPLRPIVEWCVKKVKYRGFSNMLINVRVMLDRCMGALLSKLPPPQPRQGLMVPPPPPSPTLQGLQNVPSSDGTPKSGGENSSEESTEENDEASGVQGSSSQTQSGSKEGERDEEEDGQEGEDQVPDHIPSSDGLGSEEERSEALQKLMAKASVLDKKEEHPDPTDEDKINASRSKALQAMIGKVLGTDITDLRDIDKAMPDDSMDADMEKQVERLQSAITTKSEKSQLTSNAKANVLIIDVTNDGKGDGEVELTPDEKLHVGRMRTAFFRAMGRQKIKRTSAGNAIDVQALIQYRGDHQDASVFEGSEVAQGFVYSILCDMSGSMAGTFGTVCHATEMLKQALHYPFVIGNIWGFRGGSYLPNRDNRNGEVWMYRYARDVHWYTGSQPTRLHNGRDGVIDIPVRCDGITPMNSALNVTVTHLWRKMPQGMAKRLYLLTDGSPMQTRATGKSLPDFVLRQFVANEIKVARRHGISVYTLVIGNHSISEEHCLQMFGPRRYWRRVGDKDVGSTLSALVLDDFQKYLKAR